MQHHSAYRSIQAYCWSHFVLHGCRPSLRIAAAADIAANDRTLLHDVVRLTMPKLSAAAATRRAMLLANSLS
jgi:hypothetical protein